MDSGYSNILRKQNHFRESQSYTCLETSFFFFFWFGPQGFAGSDCANWTIKCTPSPLESQRVFSKSPTH